MLLLRLTGEVSSAAARKRFGKITYTLNKLFKYHCGALEFGRDGRLHIHLLVVAQNDIASGFDRTAYRQFCLLQKGELNSCFSPEERAAYRRELPAKFNPNENLRRIREQLNTRFANGSHGFKEVRIQDLAPIIENAEAVSNYLTADLYKRSSDFQRYVKRTRMIVLPRKVPRKMNRSFSWNNRRGKLHRKKVGTIAGYLGLDRDGLKVRFGTRDWMKKVGALIGLIEQAQPLWPDMFPYHFDPVVFCLNVVRSRGW